MNLLWACLYPSQFTTSSENRYHGWWPCDSGPYPSFFFWKNFCRKLSWSLNSNHNIYDIINFFINIIIRRNTYRHNLKFTIIWFISEIELWCMLPRNGMFSSSFPTLASDGPASEASLLDSMASESHSKTFWKLMLFCLQKGIIGFSGGCLNFQVIE